MLQIRLEENLSFGVFNWEVTQSGGSILEDLISLEDMEMKIVDPTLCTHGVVSNAKILTLTQPENLEEQAQNFIR